MKFNSSLKYLVSTLGEFTLSLYISIWWVITRVVDPDTHLMWNPPWLDQDPDPFQLWRLERSENYETSFLSFLKIQTKKFFRKKSSTHFARKKNTKIFREIIFNKVRWLGLWVHTAFLGHKNIWEMFLSQNFLSQTGNFISIWNLRKLFWKITRSLGAHFFFMTHNIWLMYLF